MEMDAVNWAGYFQKTEEWNKPAYSCGLALCYMDEFRLEMLQTRSRKLLFYERSLEEFGLFSFRKRKALRRQNCYLNYIRVVKQQIQ